MIRRATLADAPEVARRGMAFIKEAGLPDGEYKECLRFCAEDLISNENGIAFLSDQGVIAGLICPLYYRPDYLQAVELFWRDDGGEGMDLLAAFEAWAVEKGAHSSNMSALPEFSSKAVARVFRMKGYSPIETVFRKELT